MMDQGTKSRVINRLFELCDGATPHPSTPDTQCEGICQDLSMTLDWLVRMRVQEVIADVFNARTFVFPPCDWGPERRTLAGFLACWIETEC